MDFLSPVCMLEHRVTESCVPALILYTFYNPCIRVITPKPGLRESPGEPPVGFGGSSLLVVLEADVV